MDKLDILFEDVKKYFANNLYKGYCKPFEIEELSQREGSDLVFVVPKGVDEDILTIDDKFEEGLTEVGKKHNVQVMIPYYCYCK